MAPKAKKTMDSNKKGSLTKGTNKLGSLTKGSKNKGSLTKGTKKSGSLTKGSNSRGSFCQRTSAMKKNPASSSKAMKVMKTNLKKSMLAKLGKTHQILRLPRKMTLQNFAKISRKQLKRHFQCGADPRMIRE